MKLKGIAVGLLLTLAGGVYAYEPVTVDFNVGGKRYEVTFEEAPKRAVTTSHFMTEMLLSLGLEDSMVGTSWADNEILPDLKEAYDRVPVLSERYPSKEVLYSVEPDFISGWHSSLDPKRLAGVEELMGNGINPYIISSLEGGATIERVYEDYMTLGRIFDIEERSQAVVADLKEAVDKAERTRGSRDRVRVFAYDSGREAPLVVAGGGLGNDIITKAGGENIFADLKGNYATASWESILDGDPEVILIVDYGSEAYEEKIDFLRKNEFTRELEAVKNNRFVVVSLAEISPGPRIAGVLEHMSKEFFEVR
ncbi:hemin receptor [Propionigenium maris DSM 9537]|uniref:Hemin receptor n=1 Tax=Propionigenium maris DSM 9537 TaxID=1123000 RepID=A0A9W6GNT7_9FUSO|nr:ABC transporter substrate-binding protein [Propionigenium maris]GLI57239.1 hemin receptor [Propionigenium maris DSM 9537]